jgi:hypothetical protein
MKQSLVLGGMVVFLGGFAIAQIPDNPPAALASQRAVLDKYCVTCHNEKLKTAGLMLDKANLAHVGDNAELWEKVVRKLRAGMMPPSGLPRPTAAAYESLTIALETELDRAALAKPKSGPPTAHRLNRTEYGNAIRQLLGLDIDPAAYLPVDDSSYGFDNVNSGLQVSPALIEGYVTAATKISRLALGHETAYGRKVYHVREDYSQEDHLEGLSFGTRGGMLIRHYFPADGEYKISWDPIRATVGSLYGGDSQDERLELTLDGERLAIYSVGKEIPLTTAHDNMSVKVNVKAGLRTVGVAWLATNYIPTADLNAHYQRSVLDDNVTMGLTFSPQVSMVTIEGPYDGKPPVDTPSREKILTCDPASETEELSCAKSILSNLARQAYRRPLKENDVEKLMGMYQSGRNPGNFEDGVERALEFILANPEFLFRIENAPATVAPGKAFHISDLELASRLSYFLWSSGPDDELIRLASRNKLREPGVLNAQVRRMLADLRSHELAKNFAGQWLELRVLASSTPEGTLFPDFDDNLRQSYRSESEMFFESMMREDRSVTDLLDADYTFVNERLAREYGIPNVYGSEFRRVQLDGDLDVRRGLLGKGSVLLATSNPDRTAPTIRGKWILMNLLGVVPPDPPPNVNILGDAVNGNAPEKTMRERMEQHRANSACASCHRLMDPIGFALENFDGVGHWRMTQYGQKLDASGQLVDGSKISGVAGLRAALLRYKPAFMRTFTEKLLTYATGAGVEYQDMPVVRSIVKEAAASQNKFSAVVMGIVNSDMFQTNLKPAPAAATVAAGRGEQQATNKQQSR